MIMLMMILILMIFMMYKMEVKRRDDVWTFFASWKLLMNDGDVAAVKDDDDSLRISRLHVLVNVVNIFDIN